LKQIKFLLAVLSSLLILVIVGGGALNNAHLGYLRYLGKDTVLLRNSTGAGATGFLIKGKSGKYHIMTNGHVCGLQENGKLLAYYRGDTYVVTVESKYPYNDLCAISAPTTVKSAFKIAKSRQYGESAYAIGHPLLEPLTVAVGELSGGVVVSVLAGYNIPESECSGPTYEFNDKLNPLAALFGIQSECIRHLEADASTLSIQPGNSGSPIVNIYGHVIAVVFAANESGTRSYAVPLSNLSEFVEGL
jgi:S1-C subfamily serine protease